MGAKMGANYMRPKKWAQGVAVGAGGIDGRGIDGRRWNRWAQHFFFVVWVCRLSFSVWVSWCQYKKARPKGRANLGAKMD